MVADFDALTCSIDAALESLVAKRRAEAPSALESVRDEIAQLRKVLTQSGGAPDLLMILGMIEAVVNDRSADLANRAQTCSSRP